MPSIFCPNCKIKIKANDTGICPKCGIKIGNKSHQPPTLPPPTNSSFQRPPVIVKDNVTEEKGNKRNWFLIVIVGFVIVASVFSYVIFGVGFFTNHKSQETVYLDVTEPTSNIEMSGQPRGIATVPGIGYDEIQFPIRLSRGSPPLNLSKMIIVFYPPSMVAPQMYIYGSDSTATTFIAQIEKGGPPVQFLAGQQQVLITFKVSPAVRAGTIINMEIIPPVGAALNTLEAVA